MNKYPAWLLYLCDVSLEEVIFRMTIISLLSIVFKNPLIVVLISALIYGLAHFILFKWEMVVATFILGILLGFVYLLTSISLIGLWMCIIVHFFAGVWAQSTGFTKATAK